MSRRPVVAIVVAYGAPDDLDACLAALARAIPVCVVDNSSSPRVREVATRHSADYIDSGRNAGFAAGVNIALRHIADPTTDVLLLNPDAIFTSVELHRLTQVLDASPRVGILSPRLEGDNGEPQRVVWPFPSPWRAALEAVGLGSLRASNTFVVGAVNLMRAECIRDVGLFDEQFFLYAEEADWQRRAAAAGWISALAPDVHAQHRGAGTSTDASTREVLFHSGQETYIRKWFGRPGWQAYRFAVILGAVGRAFVLRGPRRQEAARRARLYATGPRRAAGFRTRQPCG